MSDRITAVVLSLLMVASAAGVGVAASGGAGTVGSSDAAGSVVGSLDEPRDADRGGDRGGGDDRADDGRDRGREGGSDDDGDRDRSRPDGDSGSDGGTGAEDGGNATDGSGDDADSPAREGDGERTQVPHSVTLPPDPTPTFTQPSGETFEAQFWTEGLSVAWRTAEGYTVLQGEDGYWRYAAREGGSLVPTDARVGIDDVPGSVSPGLEPTDPADSGPRAAPGATTDGADVGTDAAPTTGTANFPVVLINFTDTTVSYTESDFQSLLFGTDPSIATGPGSVTDYYDEASYGQLTVTGDVEGWVTADNDQAYYGEGGINDSGCCFNATELVEEAAQKADPQIDYSQYDNDGDGVVDQFVVVHQGAGQEVSGNSEDIWSHKFEIDYVTNDLNASGEPIYVRGYVIQPEELEESSDTMSTIGVFAHEFGHAFGLPDLYDTDGSSQGIGRWGLMGSGSYGTVDTLGDAPNHMTAWSKEFMDWIDPPEVTLGEAVSGTSLGNVANNNDYYKVLNETNNTFGEYFYVANRQRVGFDQGLDGEGLLITHINESKITSESCFNDNSCNDDETNKLVDVEAADGNRDLDNNNNRGDAGDPWTEGTGDFNDSSTPSSTFKNGRSSGVSVGSIQFSGGTASGTATLDISVVELLAEQWSANVGGRAQFATPAVGPDRVFLGGLGSDVRAVYRANGSTDWSVSRAGSLADSSPVLASGTVYVGSGGGVVYALDAASGSVQWSHTTDSAVVSTPAVAGGTVYVGSNDGTVLALDAGGGTVQWTTETGEAILSTVETGNGRVYVTLDDGTVLALDASNGNVQWSRDVGSDLGHSSPTFDSGTLYVAGDDVYALDASSGSTSWQVNTDENVGSSPTVVGNTLYVGVQNGTLHALDTSDGSTRWSYLTGEVIRSTPAVSNDRVVFGTDAGTIHLLNASTGSKTKTVSMSGKVRSSPTIAGGTVYVGADSGNYVSLENIER